MTQKKMTEKKKPETLKDEALDATSGGAVQAIREAASRPKCG